jgi:outer membrane protein insertion porin family
VKIKEITIEGNQYISDKEIKKTMKTKEHWFLSFITGSGIYNKEDMSADLERVKVLYHSKGFIDVTVSDSELTLGPKRKKLYIKFSVSEGEQYSIGEVAFSGNNVFESAKLYEQVETVSGKIFNRTALRSDIDKIIDLYSEKGYATADI